MANPTDLLIYTAEEKKKIHPLNTTDEVKMAMSFEKKKILGYIAKIESSVVFIE